MGGINRGWCIMRYRVVRMDISGGVILWWCRNGSPDADRMHRICDKLSKRYPAHVFAVEIVIE